MAFSSVMVNISQPAIPLFNGEAYDRWSTLMRALFMSQEVWDVVEAGHDDEDKVEARLKENRKRDSKALFLILQSVDRHIITHIKNSTTSHKAWTILKTEFTGSSKYVLVRRQRLHNQFEVSQMKANESIHNYVTRMLEVENELRAYGREITEIAAAAKVLWTLTAKFDHIVVVIEESKDLDKLTIDELSGSLLTHEVCINR